jgi:hypothetical protein
MGMFDGKSKTVAEFLDAVPADRRGVAKEVLAFVRKNMPKGYEEAMSLGFVTWRVPLSVFPDTYNGQALWYVAFQSTKAGFSLYLMTVYGHKDREAKFKAAYKAVGKKLDMGKACLRFKTMDDLVIPAVRDAIKSAPMKKYVAEYRAIRKATTKAGK